MKRNGNNRATMASKAQMHQRLAVDSVEGCGGYQKLETESGWWNGTVQRRVRIRGSHRVYKHLEKFGTVGIRARM